MLRSALGRAFGVIAFGLMLLVATSGTAASARTTDLTTPTYGYGDNPTQRPDARHVDEAGLTGRDGATTTRATGSDGRSAHFADLTPVGGARFATNSADDLVRFDPEFASRQIAGQNLPGSAGCATTPGGNTLSVHAAERTLIGGPGRSPIDPALIDDILQQSTRTAYRGLNDTVKVSAPNLCGKCCVVLDAQTGKHVVTVMVPK